MYFSIPKNLKEKNSYLCLGVVRTSLQLWRFRHIYRRIFTDVLISFQTWINLIEYAQTISSKKLWIFSDASTTGWGASCGKLRTHDWWSKDNKILHINAIELKAAFNALCCFAENLYNCDILLRIDNTTALAYINKFGSINSIQYPYLSEISRQIWSCCEDRIQVYLFLPHTFLP